MTDQITSKIQFRNKFFKRIQNCLEPLRLKLEEATITFVNDPDNQKCHELLWLMTCEPAKALKTFNLEIKSSEEEPVTDESKKLQATDEGSIVPEDLVFPWRDELRYQRSIIYKDFLKPEIPESCQEAYNILLKTTNPIVAVVVYNTCNSFCQYSSQQDIDRVLFLMTNSKEENVFGGIRSIHFNKAEALVLKTYASQIHNLLEALWKEQISRKELEANRPLARQLEGWYQTHEVADGSDEDNADIVVPSGKTIPTDKGVPVEEFPSQDSSDPAEMLETEKNLSPQNILADTDLFEKFVGAYHQLKEAGYDIQKVVDKMEAIVKILEASKILDN